MEPIKILEVKSELGAGTRGASLGIDALKTACLDKNSDYFVNYDLEEVEHMNEMLFEGFRHPHAKFIDGVYTMEKRVAKAVYDTIEDGFFPLVLAGDHSTAAGTIAGIKKANPTKRLGVIWIDAHADLHSPFTTPSGNMHGMPLAMVLNEDNLEWKRNDVKAGTMDYWTKIKNIGIKGPKISPKDLVFVSTRDTEEEELHLIAKYSIRNFSPQEIDEKGIEQVAREVLEKLADCDLIYISFDVDSMDPKLSEGTGTPVDNGLTFAEAMTLNTLLVRDPRVCCWEMVEVNPTLDSLNMMAETAFDILEATTDALIEARASKEVVRGS